MEGLFAGIEAWLTGMGGWAYICAPLVMAVVAILPFPAEIPAALNGMLFGPVVGSLVSWSGSMVGAWISFEVARGLGRPVAERMVRAEALERVDALVEGAGWWGLLVARFIPLVAFTALNWGAGLCAIPRRRFLWTTAVGIAPGAVFFTTSGVGLLALYRSYPLAAGAVVLFVVAGTVYWSYTRKHRGPVDS